MTYPYVIQKCPGRRLRRWRVVNPYVAYSGLIIGHFMTRRGAERWIDRNTWQAVR